MKTVRQVLRNKGYTVQTIPPEAPVFEALQRMADEDVGALVVVKDGEVVGIFSERDYARKVVLEGRSSRETPVQDIMSRSVVCVSSEQRMESCMELMTEEHVRHLPVLEDQQLAGVISIGDVVKAIIEDQEFTIEELEHYIRGTCGFSESNPPPSRRR
jgi:CBS domain-containing protein